MQNVTYSGNHRDLPSGSSAVEREGVKTVAEHNARRSRHVEIVTYSNNLGAKLIRRARWKFAVNHVYSVSHGPKTVSFG